MTRKPFQQLAERLDALPNGFPPTEDGVELTLLAHIFTPEEASLAAQLGSNLEAPAQIAKRVGEDEEHTLQSLKAMARKGLIKAGRMEEGLGFKLMPFVVGIYEMQIGRIDADLARIFEKYYLEAFGQTLSIEPQVHRVIPVGESIRMDMEVSPYENVAEIIEGVQAWGVLDCICRKQKLLIDEPCDHPIDVCMMLSKRPGAFDSSSTVQSVTQEEALATLQRAADAGLVHSVTNSQDGVWYICNCCTCSCGILRGMVDLGLANVVARSAFVNQVEDALCTGCEICLETCQFDALSMAETAVVDTSRCVGCGVCVHSCPDEALILIRRPEAEIKPPPVTEEKWLEARAAARGLAPWEQRLQG